MAVAKLLNNKGQKVIVLEKSQQKTLIKLAKDLEDKGIRVELGKPLAISSFKPWLPYIDLVITSPGIPWDNPTLNFLREKGIRVKSEISIAWQYLKNIPWVGITGTNGKTTVTHLLNHVLNQSFINSRLGGNVGKAACELAIELDKSPEQKTKWLIMELSSYQIETAPEISPQIGIWTTLTPDHLERHGSIENYIRIKRQLIENSSVRIYNADDEYLRNNKSTLPDGIWVSTSNPSLNKDINPIDFWIDSDGKVSERGQPLFDSSVLNICGEHNLQNLLLVTAAAREIGVSSKQIEKAISSFQGIEHRFQKVYSSKNLDIFNDSKATNFDSSSIALKSVIGPAILIAGGQLKKGDPTQWIKNIQQKVSTVILFGESKEKLRKLLISNGFIGKVYSVKTLNEAVEISSEIYLKRAIKTILLSPACASFDLYNNFEERGNHFQELIKKHF
ncbi:UDP-N-acetylmuramoylalanine--D-glutamate ligase [Prochlorococcus sp. MIT 0602]|nr:UDP-N-acetylmuramoylalanine--D-glutamate ligase [Prochlorococcus sp. MIT 0603]KGG18068.1 UDP-N-acetylmuramoylalanine--D-glutamate ligase [Prochlorococcus sp. MIT 0602]